MKRVWAGMLASCAAGCGPAPAPVLVVAQPDAAMPFCTRTLGLAECFADPEDLANRPSGLGDMPVRVHLLRPAPWWRVFE